MDAHRRRLTLCRIALAVALLGALGTVSAAEIFTRATLGGGEIPGTPPTPVLPSSMTSTTGLSEAIFDANNLARADASAGAQLGQLRVEVRSVPPITGGAAALATFGDFWTPVVGFCFLCDALFGINPVVNIEGTIGPTGIPSGDLRFQYDFSAQFGSGTLTVPISNLRFSIDHDGGSSGQVCTGFGCIPLGVAATTQPDGSTHFLANVVLPKLGLSGVDILGLAATNGGFDGVIEQVRLSAQLDEGTCCDPGFVDFFNTVTVGLQADDPGSAGLWANASGRAIIQAASSTVDEPGTLLLLLTSLSWGALIISRRKRVERRLPPRSHAG